MFPITRHNGQQTMKIFVITNIRNSWKISLEFFQPEIYFINSEISTKDIKDLSDLQYQNQKLRNLGVTCARGSGDYSNSVKTWKIDNWSCAAMKWS